MRECWVAAIDVGFTLDAIGCDFKRPREDQHGDEAEREHDDDRTQGPIGRAERGQDDGQQLERQPRDRRVGGSDAEHVAPLEFGQQAGHRGFR